METTQEIQDRIKNKKTRQDKNGRDYLILELEKGENIFVFDNRNTPQEKWEELQELDEYIFTVREGNRIGSNVLTHFEKMDFLI